MWFYHKIMCLKNADGMGTSVDLNQTAPVVFVRIVRIIMVIRK